MAPVLFLFLMNAFADSLETIWESKGLERMQVVRASDEDFENGIGIVRGHTPKQYQSSKLDILSIFQCLYVDDGAFPFNSREQCTSSTSVHSSRTTFGTTSISTFASRRRAKPWVLSSTSSTTSTSIPTPST